MCKYGIDWSDQSEFPDELNPAHNGLSIDVLVYNNKTEEHTIGWFDFEKMGWNFLNNEGQEKFIWRYFVKGIDTGFEN